MELEAGAHGPRTSEVRITDPVTGGQKGQKPERFDLIPWDALEEVARVYGIGAKKYEDHNWLKGYRWSLSFGAMMRHAALAIIGEDRDKESGCLHWAHACWHCLTLITYTLRGLGTDDRIKVRT
jgi:dATP/dGTP diphosphohydrolase